MTVDSTSVFALADTKEKYIVQESNDNEPSYNGTMYTGFLPRTSFLELNDTSKFNGEFRFWLFEPETVLHDDLLAVVLGDNSFIKDCIFDDAVNGLSRKNRIYDEFTDRFSRYPNNDEGNTANMCWWTKTTRILFVETMPGFSSIGMVEDFGNAYSTFFQNFFSIFDSLSGKKIILVGDGGYGEPFMYSGYGKSLVYSAYSMMQKNKNTNELSPNIIGVGLPFESGSLLSMIKNLRWYGVVDVSVAKKLQKSFANCAVVAPTDRYESSAWIKDECVVGKVALISASDKPHPLGTLITDEKTTSTEPMGGTGTRGVTAERLRTLKNPEVEDPWNAQRPWTMPTFVFLTWD